MRADKLVRHILYIVLLTMMPVFYSRADSLYNNPYITFSPDGKAFTTDENNKNTEWYIKGEEVSTGVLSSLRLLKEGEHFYYAVREGNVPISKWEVVWQGAGCCHKNYPFTEYFHGITYNRKVCFSPYFSGWMATCADCGEIITPMHVYMSREAAASIKDLDMGLVYYYLCPFCNNLEQGSPLGIHKCKKYSWNQYKVTYINNGGSGYMPSSTHMYNNENVYEGKEITPQTKLSKNTYYRAGFIFNGWNTEAEGSGKWFEDGQEILNLTNEDKGSIILYAQWLPVESSLEIDPAGGLYDGVKQNKVITQEYHSEYILRPELLIPPQGYTISFQTQGGSLVPDIISGRQFREWKIEMPSNGLLWENKYTFLGANGTVDKVTAVYIDKTVILPDAKRDDYSFGGWYADSDCHVPIGSAGDEVLFDKNTVLYAKWVNLTLSSKDNYNANGGKGAVDLSWLQNDGGAKMYRIYQSEDMANWNLIYDRDLIGKDAAICVSKGFTGREETYTVLQSGYYSITVYGAQGGNYSGFSGGLGGMVSANVWLDRGEVLTYSVGGQNGFNGGGSGLMFSNGGGCTELSSNQKGRLLIAGGGGGATSLGNGGAGGSSSGVIDGGIQGASGGAGGGGGCQGGAAGELLLHNHNGNCRHLHSGSATAGGGCYTIPKECGSVSFTQVITNEIFYYGNIEWDSEKEDWVHCWCVQCGSDSCGGHLKQEFKYVCNNCHIEYSSRPNTCKELFGYVLGCGRTEDYICGYTERQILSSKPAYGGSNYINTQYCIAKTDCSGTRSQDGALEIQSVSVGYIDNNELKGVAATDKAAPEKVYKNSILKQALSSDLVKISWSVPEDHGTDYYHRAESYAAKTSDRLCQSNETVNCLVSGIAGYYYVLDTSEHVIVNARNGVFIKEPATNIKLTMNRQYLHLAAVDKAGNISETLDLEVGTGDEEVAWPLMTDKILITSHTDTYFPSSLQDTYFVKCGQASSFCLSFDGFIKNNASVDYQVNQLTFDLLPDGGSTSRFIVNVPNSAIIENRTQTIPPSDISKSTEGIGLLEDDAYTVVRRSNHCQNLSIQQRFSLPEEAHGVKIRVTPVAGARWKDGMAYSQWDHDISNSIYLIGDGKSPEIKGTEVFDDLKIIDRGQGNLTLLFTAVDYESGMKEFYAIVSNQDNNSRKTLKVGADGILTIPITEDNELFTGDFTVEFHAIDNVGNETIESYGSQEFALTAYIERILEPHTPVFKCGESGILYITAVGYADRVEVEFPEELTALDPDLNRRFIYKIPSYRQVEQLEFMIPLGSPMSEFQITVRACKDGTEIEQHPRISTIGIEGTVLDDIRTRLR